MLNVFRDNLRHLKWLLIVVAVSMLAYLGLYFDSGSGREAGTWAAKVNGEAIPAVEFLESARRQDDFYRRLLGAQYDQMKKQMRLGSQVMQSLIDQRIMLAEARKLGLEATREEVSRRILNDPNFKDPSGNFIGKDRYTQVINANWAGGVADFEQNLAKELTVQKWIDVVTEGAQVSDQELEQLYRSRNDKAAVDFVYLPPGKVAFDSEVTDAAAAAWYEAHQDAYRRGEARKIRYLLVDRQAQIAKVTITDDELRSFYEANKAQYARPEQRRARQILFRFAEKGAAADRKALRQLADSVSDRVRKGEDFATLARAMSQDVETAPQGGDLGWVGRNDVAPAVSRAVFETPVGQVGPVVESEVGYHIVQVTDVRPEGTSTFDELKEPIRRQLELRKAQDAVQAEAQRIRGSIQSSADLDSVAAKENFKIQEAVVARDDRGLDIGPSPEFMNSVFSIPTGQVTPVVAVSRGMAIVSVVEVLPPAIRPLAEVKTRVSADVLNDRSASAAAAAARRALETGKDLAGAARVLGLSVQSSGDLTMGQTMLPGVGRVEALDNALSTPGVAVGSTGTVMVNGGAVLYAVTRRDAFDPARFQSTKDELRAEILQRRRSGMLQSILETMRQRQKIEINDPLVNQANG